MAVVPPVGTDALDQRAEPGGVLGRACERSWAGTRWAGVVRALRPVADAPALILERERPGSERWLILADLHLGLESDPSRPTGLPEGSAPGIADQIIALLRRERADGLMVAGDVKHPIVGTPPYLRPIVFAFFGALLETGARVEVVLGNHDGGLVPQLPREVTVHGSEGAVIDDVGIFHGHRWPSKKVLASRRLVVGHLHPGYRFAPTVDHPDGKRRCWIRVERSPARLPPGRKRPGRWISARELVVLPPFNPLAGVESLNRERPSRGRSFLYRRFLSNGVARAYLLDGTDLGILPRRWVSSDVPSTS